MNPQAYSQEHKTIPKISNGDTSNTNNRFSSVKNSLQSCMGFVDGLCCASLTQVSAEDREERSRAHLRDFMTSYDLSYLNSNIGETNSTTSSSSNNNAEKETSMNSPASESKMTTFPSVVQKSTTHQESSARMHTILPNSMLPREYGSPSTPDINTRSDYLSESSSCCHSFPQFRGFDDCHDSHAQPRTLPSADTYTTVSMSHSYSAMMWDDDDEEEEDISSDYILSPVDSVFRKDEDMEEASVERDGPPSCSPSSSPFPTSSNIATKTHEAYQYLLRMKPQNYLHGSGSSSEDLSGGELDENYSNSRNLGSDVTQCGPLFLQ